MLPQTAIPLINKLGRERTPFLVLVDFEAADIVVHKLADLDPAILYNFNDHTNQVQNEKISARPILEVEPYPFDEYYHEFDKVMDELLYGNTFLINLTARHKVLTESSLRDIYTAAQAKYKLYLEDKFVFFSPETFVKIKEGIISSNPMKGTIDANIPEAKKLLMDDKKEMAEHYTIVDLIRNDLSIYAKEVQVTKFRYLDLIKSNTKDLYQVSSEIQGKLPANYHEQLGDILFSLLPAGSISGAPKKKTVDIISKTEAHQRGYYTGVAGIYDGSSFDSCVMIRYIENHNGQFYYRSGGGITFQSTVEKEYLEMLDKIYIPTS